MVVLPEVWELIECFKDLCLLKGWRVRLREDLVEASGEYHSFLWAQRVNPYTFRKIVLRPLRSVVQEGVSYRMVDVSYMAWLLPDTPPINAMKLVMERSGLLGRIAIYDLSLAYTGELHCFGLNETGSVVFQEFERFLNREYGVKVMRIHRTSHWRSMMLSHRGEEIVNSLSGDHPKTPAEIVFAGP